MKETYNNIIIYQNTNSEKRKVEKVHSKYFGNRQVLSSLDQKEPRLID